MTRLLFVIWFFVSCIAAPIQVEIPFGKTVIHAINCGGGEFESDIDGITYEADKFFIGTGHTEVLQTTAMVDGNDPPLYQSERYGPRVTYVLGLEKKGFYTLVLKFAETQVRSSDMRTFHVALNSEVVIAHVDIYRVVGPDAALDVPIPFFFTGKSIRLSEDVQVPLASKEITIDLIAAIGNAKVNAIVLVKGVLTKVHPDVPPERDDIDVLLEYAILFALALCCLILAAMGCRPFKELYRYLFGRKKKLKVVTAAKKTVRQ